MSVCSRAVRSNGEEVAWPQQMAYQQNERPDRKIKVTVFQTFRQSRLGVG